MLHPLLVRDSGLSWPALRFRVARLPRLVAGVMPISNIVGEDVTELADDVLPNSLCVD